MTTGPGYFKSIKLLDHPSCCSCLCLYVPPAACYWWPSIVTADHEWTSIADESPRRAYKSSDIVVSCIRLEHDATRMRSSLRSLELHPLSTMLLTQIFNSSCVNNGFSKRMKTQGDLLCCKLSDSKNQLFINAARLAIVQAIYSHSNSFNQIVALSQDDDQLNHVTIVIWKHVRVHAGFNLQMVHELKKIVRVRNPMTNQLGIWSHISIHAFLWSRYKVDATPCSKGLCMYRHCSSNPQSLSRSSMRTRKSFEFDWFENIYW
jgi:hypothetical protein